jgi:tetratricopeptide (TPR) repeat protein
MGLAYNPGIGGKLAVMLLLSSLAGCATSEVAKEVALKQQLVQSEQKNNIASLSEVIKANPNDANALNLRGAAYGQAGDFESALADFNAALAINSQFPQAYANRALVYVRLKKLREAVADYDRAIEIDPNYASAYVGRGNVHRLVKNHPMAIADFTRAIEIEPDPVALFNRGLSRQATGQHAQAIDDFDGALGFRADAPDVYYAKGLSEMALRKFEGAYDDFYKAAQGSKNNFEAWALRGQAAEALGEKREAARAYQRALQINPSFRPAREGLERVGRDAA